MPNPVHLIVLPEHVDALRVAFPKAHRAYAGRIHARGKRDGGISAGTRRLHGDRGAASAGGVARSLPPRRRGSRSTRCGRD